MAITPHLKEINALTLNKWLQRQQVLLIDVREIEEFMAEHIAEAKLMPLSQFDPTMIPRDTKQKIVLQCQSGGRSAEAAQKMFELGFEEIYHLRGGLPTWKAAGYPTQVNKKAPISMFRQVQIVSGSLMLLGTILGALISPWFLLLSGFISLGLIVAGITNTCALAMLLAKLSYNRKAINKGEMIL